MIIACGKGKVEQVHIKIKCGHGILFDTVKCWIQNCCRCIKIEENKIHRRFKSTYFAYLVLWLSPCLHFLEQLELQHLQNYYSLESKNDWSLWDDNVTTFFMTELWDRVMVFNATFSNISVVSSQSVLLVEETRVPRDNH